MVRAIDRPINRKNRSAKRGTIGDNIMYFETGQGSALSANAHHGVDQQTLEARAYGLARHFQPMLVNTVVGFIGPEYLYDGKQILRAGLEDHFCGKLLGLPMGCDICYTNHADADQDESLICLRWPGVFKARNRFAIARFAGGSGASAVTGGENCGSGRRALS